MARIFRSPINREVLRREWTLFRTIVVPGADLRIGAVFAIGVFLLALFEESLRREHLLDVSAASGVAILAIVIAITAIFSSFLTEEYVLLLQRALGDVDTALYHYRAVAGVSCAATIVAFIGLLTWPISPGWAQALEMGTSLGLSVWALVGAAQLVGITARHGHWRSRLRELPEAYQEGRKKAS